MSFVGGTFVINNIIFYLTGLSGGARHRLRRRSTSKVVHGHHVELVLGVGTQRTDAIEHCAYTTDLAEGLWM